MEEKGRTREENHDWSILYTFVKGDNEIVLLLMILIDFNYLLLPAE